ncbi:MAG: hypothetical protein WCO33_00795 [bacterium]
MLKFQGALPWKIFFTSSPVNIPVLAKLSNGSGVPSLKLKPYLSNTAFCF